MPVYRLVDTRLSGSMGLKWMTTLYAQFSLLPVMQAWLNLMLSPMRAVQEHMETWMFEYVQVFFLGF